MKDGLHTIIDRAPAVIEATRALTREQVLVGVPDTNAGKGREPGDPNNALLARIHDQGDPTANIPARPFMVPGMKEGQPKYLPHLRRAGVAALAGDAVGVQRALHAAGLVAASAVQAVITRGILPPLAPSTVRGRIARRKSKAWRAKRRAEVAANVAAGEAPGARIFTPLIDTGALRASITYVLRRR